MPSPDTGWHAGTTCSDLPADTSTTICDQPPLKRRKTLLACNHCRARKTRCDGKRPVCRACEKRGSGQECLYEEGALKTHKYIEALENRLERLEREDNGRLVELNEAGSGLHNGRVKRKKDGRRGSSSREGDDITFSLGSNGSATSPAAVQIGSVESPDALATVSASTNHHQLYGASSTIAFVDRVLIATGQSSHLVEASSVGAEDILQIQSVGQPRPADLDLLPIRRICDSYLKSFWDVAHPVFPILHRPTFMQFYNQIWEPKSPSEASDLAKDAVMLATLNLVLAIGCRFNESVTPGSRGLVAEQFYQRARRLVPIDTLDAASIPIVQELLLTAVHLQSTMYSSRCWNIVGLAMRVAQSLGLHLSPTKSGSNNQLEREMRRRVWYTCVTLDRLLCTTFGRPGMLSHTSAVPLPLMVDDEYLLENGEGIQPEGSEGRMGLFVYTLKLFDILTEVLHCFYTEDGSANDNQPAPLLKVDELLRLDSKLSLFLESLPNNLQLRKITRSLEAPTGSSLLQARILYCRFLYTRLLLLRPVIVLASKRNSDAGMTDGSDLRGGVAMRMCQVCLDTAHELISVLHEGRGSLYRSSAWWTIYFTFGAATVVLASLLCPPQGTNISFDSSISMAMDIFRHYAPELESAVHARRVLETLRHRLLRMVQSGTMAECGGQTTEDFSATPPSNLGPDGIECGSEFLIPDPLSEDWFFHQSMMSFDIPDYF